MLALRRFQLSQSICAGAWRTYATPVNPYWHAKFPDGVKSFENIPTVPGGYDPQKVHEVAEGWFKKYGHIVKEVYPNGKYTVHLFHFEDFRTVYNNDTEFPIRHSHQVIAHYREQRKHLYDHVGLGPGQGEEWRHLRRIAAGKSFVLRPSKTMSEDAADDLVEIIKNNLNDKGEIDLLPWLHRWSFEGIGIVALNRRLNALSRVNNELADKMVKAAALTDEIIYLTTLDPITKYDERFKQLTEAQDFFYSVLRGYIEDIKRDMELEPETQGTAQILLQGGTCTQNDAITIILDLFQGALQTVPLTALMALYNVARNSDIQAKVREDIMTRMPTKDSRYFDDAVSGGLVKSIIFETLRLHTPIIGNGRIIQKDLVLGGYSVPAYTNTLLHFQVAFRQKENFKEPLKFIPNRTDANLFQVNHVFGGRRRACLGSGFALRELYLIFSKILRNFEVFYDGDEVTFVNKLHNRPDKPLILRLKPIDE